MYRHADARTAGLWLDVGGPILAQLQTVSSQSKATTQVAGLRLKQVATVHRYRRWIGGRYEWWFSLEFAH